MHDRVNCEHTKQDKSLFSCIQSHSPILCCQTDPPLIGLNIFRLELKWQWKTGLWYLFFLRPILWNMITIADISSYRPVSAWGLCKAFYIPADSKTTNFTTLALELSGFHNAEQNQSQRWASASSEQRPDSAAPETLYDGTGSCFPPELYLLNDSKISLTFLLAHKKPRMFRVEYEARFVFTILLSLRILYMPPLTAFPELECTSWERICKHWWQRATWSSVCLCCVQGPLYSDRDGRTILRILSSSASKSKQRQRGFKRENGQDFLIFFLLCLLFC